MGFYSSAEANRLKRMSNSGIGPDTYRAELNDVSDEMAANVRLEDYYRQGADNYADTQRGFQLQQMGLDQQSQVNQQNILAREQARRENETRSKYQMLNQQSANQLAGQKSMMEGIKGLMGGSQGLLSGLLGSGSTGTPTTTMFNSAGTPFGGTSYRGGTLSGLAKPGKPPVFG